MKKSKKGVPVIIFLLVFLFIVFSIHDHQAGGRESTTVLAPKADAADLDIRVKNDAQESGISIRLDLDGAKDTPAADTADDGSKDGIRVSTAYLEEEGTKPNPVLNFFDTLAAGVAGTVRRTDQISIVIDENEHNDTDVSHEITIDVEDYPIDKSDNPTVLIYHTHTREAYMPEFEGQYAACGTFRTDDQRYSVCAVGQKLADQLSQTYGFTVIHDTTMNEVTPFTQCYEKSLETVKKDLEKNPNIDVFIDVHRDSVADTAYAQSQVIEKDGKRYAKVMFVVGRGDDYTGTEAPDWQSNYALAQAVTDRINEIMPGLARKPMTKTKRYNQHLSDKCMLIEVGYDANSITEAENSVDIVSQALAEVLAK